ncbi:low affinity copper transporter [Colletotrichum phormii]|uniref:Copper transport protein n=1 Tax=Colletotrichum phormii TaxID=359342 RepID=A0AAI9ZPC0_9PEZI|nr:low affinity copper transporter [Colletotrichum phormii]KAK1635690.1 low affinity copper transporter [Colletotrichum phormii]
MKHRLDSDLAMDMPNTQSHSHGIEPMPVVFHTKMATALFSEAWTPRTSGQYAGTCLALIVFTIILRTMIAFKPMLEATVWGRESRKSHSRSDEELGHEEKSSPPTPKSILLRVALAAYEVVIALLGYLLMLAVMSMNLGYFLSILLGVFVGTLCLGGIARSTTFDHCS